MLIYGDIRSILFVYVVKGMNTGINTNKIQWTSGSALASEKDETEKSEVKCALRSI